MTSFKYQTKLQHIPTPFKYGYTTNYNNMIVTPTSSPQIIYKKNLRSLMLPKFKIMVDYMLHFNSFYGRTDMLNFLESSKQKTANLWEMVGHTERHIHSLTVPFINTDF